MTSGPHIRSVGSGKPKPRSNRGSPSGEPPRSLPEKEGVYEMEMSRMGQARPAILRDAETGRGGPTSDEGEWNVGSIREGMEG